MSQFIKSIKHGWQRKNSLVCVGLDPDLSRLPPHLLEQPNPVFEFCRQIVDQTHDLVCAYKPQIAYFADQGVEDQLAQIIDYIHRQYPGVPVILDAKRGDIGSTAARYALETFERFKADAVTINPYMGKDSAQPFLDYADKGVVILCRTSNAGGADLQDLDCNSVPLYQHVARQVSETWNTNNNCCLVVGATWPQQMAQVRAIVGDMPLLVPGVGTQGGDVKALLEAGLSKAGDGLIINSARAIIFASQGVDFATAARQATLELRDQINLYR